MRDLYHDDIESFVEDTLGVEDPKWCADYLLEEEDVVLPRVRKKLPDVPMKTIRAVLRSGVHELVKAHYQRMHQEE